MESEAPHNWSVAVRFSAWVIGILIVSVAVVSIGLRGADAPNCSGYRDVVAREGDTISSIVARETILADRVEKKTIDKWVRLTNSHGRWHDVRPGQVISVPRKCQSNYGFFN